jgi:hypothetical protein
MAGCWRRWRRVEPDPGAAVAVLAIDRRARLCRRQAHDHPLREPSFLPAVGKDHRTPTASFSLQSAQNWLDHQWRRAPASRSSPFGSQNGEWQSFSFARNLDDTAAKLSISMGGQIVGFSYSSLGFESGADVRRLTASERNQIWGCSTLSRGRRPIRGGCRRSRRRTS